MFFFYLNWFQGRRTLRLWEHGGADVKGQVTSTREYDLHSKNTTILWTSVYLHVQKRGYCFYLRHSTQIFIRIPDLYLLLWAFSRRTSLVFPPILLFFFLLRAITKRVSFQKFNLMFSQATV